MALRFLLGVILSWACVASVFAKSVYVPEVLQPWRAWVLQDARDIQCPFFYQSHTQRQCQWPGVLHLQVSEAGATVEQTWEIFAEGWVALPGSEGFWPNAVVVNDEPAIVVEKNARPYLYLTPGTYHISAFTPWQHRPDSFQLPVETGLLLLSINGKAITDPQIDSSGRVWLVARTQPSEHEKNTTDQEDKLTLRVFRHLQDDIPFRMDTRIELEVAGRSREMVLGKILFDGYLPQSFSSPLPARIDADGQLRIQLRPGQWSVQLSAYRTDPVDKVYLESTEEGFWPQEEVWVFQSYAPLRQVRIEGVESIDPNQTLLPDFWKQWPAYRIKSGQGMDIVTLRRGDPQPSPNRLNNQRDLWLDFDGDGLTVKDHLNGTLNRDWRLNADVSLALGSLTLNGAPQVITEMDRVQGVEVRTGNLNALALSRMPELIAGHQLQFPSSGWQHDFDQLSATLHLPPGWRAVFVDGVDRVSNTWSNSWSVWDVFLLLITVAALFRLRGFMTALVGALALILVYPESSASMFLVLNVVAIMSVLFLLPEGKLRRLLNGYGGVAAIALVLWLLGFMVEQARLGFYPQLQYPWQQMGNAYQGNEPGDYADDSMMEEVAAMRSMSVQQDMEKAPMVSSVVRSKIAKQYNASPSIEQFDPNLAAQTGPGMPSWSWQRVDLNWSGPVTQQESTTIWLLNPLENKILCWLRVVLSALMVLLLFGLTRNGGNWAMNLWRARDASGVRATALALMVSGLFLLPHSQPASADIPDSALLESLKQRLINETDCTPACLSIAKSQIDLNANRLTLRFSVQALQAVYWPLPESQKQWSVDSVLLDNLAHTTARMGGGLHLYVPAGEHEVVISGWIDPNKPFQLSFKTTPHNIVMHSGSFIVKGLDNGKLISDSLYFYPAQGVETPKPEKEATLSPDPVTAFVNVERTLKLGLNWYLETRVQRVAPQQGGINLDIPLLQGESVTSQGVDIKNGMVSVVLTPGQNQLVWYSSLAKTSQMTLVAPQTSSWVEQWAVEPSPLWHVESQGIAPVKETSTIEQWKPRWQPYPGEKVELRIIKPKAVAGATNTIDRVEQTWTPGQRESQSQMRFHVISSKGYEQRIDLPVGSKVKQVLVDNEQRAVDEESSTIIVPVNPGDHWLEVHWRESHGLPFHATTPIVDLHESFVNHSIQVQVPSDRWVLFVGGPAMGPAILFWGVLLVSVVIAFALGRIPHFPLSSWQWILLTLGFCAGWIEAMVPVVIWFFLIEKRQSQWVDRLNPVQFNFMQLVLAGFSIFTIALILAAIPNGLLGSPDMGVLGNGSSQYYLNWFVDGGVGQADSAWFVSLPLWVYRLLMLLWSLWLAVNGLRWIKWGWQAYIHGGYWHSKDQN